MAALMPRSFPRRGKGRAPVNAYVIDGGKRYRICTHGSHVLLIALKTPKGAERMLTQGGRRWKQVLKLCSNLT